MFRLVSCPLITLVVLTILGCDGGGKKLLPPVEKGYARITINWWNYPSDSSTLRGRYIPSVIDKIAVIIYDANNNVVGSGIIERPNSEIIIELPVGRDYIGEAKGFDRNNNFIGGGRSDRFEIQASITTDVRITIVGINEPNNNNRDGAIELVFSNNQASYREIFHTHPPKDSMDWFRFNSRNDKAYTIHFSVLESTDDSNNWKIKISIYDGNALVKESSSPGPAVPPPPVTVSKPASGVVYIRLETTEGIFKGWYKLDVYQLDLGSAKFIVD